LRRQPVAFRQRPALHRPADPVACPPRSADQVTAGHVTQVTEVTSPRRQRAAEWG
jgi:hypothetical protein